MGLQSKLFTIPSDPQLEACLVSDAAHITQTQNSRGEHVRKIQIALNQLSYGKLFLAMDGIYGPKTAAAVKAYKDAPQRRIRQPWQTTADDIVGKQTIRSLDNEMDILENELPEESGLISTTGSGLPHPHAECPEPLSFKGETWEGRISHRGTPINPKNFKRKINIYGEGETNYLGFKDYATEQQYALNRPLLSTLADNCASDICVRSAPLSAQSTRSEIKRIASPISEGGCRFTYASNQEAFNVLFLVSLGTVIQHAKLASKDREPDPTWDLDVWVIEIRK